MPRKPITFETVCAFGRTLPDVEESTMYGTPALKVRGQWLVCVPTNKAAEPGSLAVRIDVAQRDELIATEPEVYYVKDHYVGYPVVLLLWKSLAPWPVRKAPHEPPVTLIVAAFNEKVYAELFITPKSDPWLGLLPSDVYTGLENGGVVGK